MLSSNIKKGKEFKVLYHASAAVICNSNLPYVMVTCYMWRQFASYCNVIYSSYNKLIIYIYFNGL
jgi:hypothetical protein